MDGWTGHADPYVLTYLDGAEQSRTETIHNTGEPVWEQGLFFVFILFDLIFFFFFFFFSLFIIIIFFLFIHLSILVFIYLSLSPSLNHQYF